MTKTDSHKMHFATELRYLGHGTIESRHADHLIVQIAGMGRVKIAPDMVFTTKRDALTFAQVPQRAGWNDVAKLNLVA